MDTIQYRGAYRFADPATLSDALSTALKDAADWRPLFTAHGTSLRVQLDLRAAGQRARATQVMQTLAYLAVEGIVVARQREVAIDVFVCGE